MEQRKRKGERIFEEEGGVCGCKKKSDVSFVKSKKKTKPVYI